MSEFEGLDLNDLLLAMRIVESGNKPDGTRILGDNGDSRGPLQIQAPYHHDSVGNCFPYSKVDWWRYSVRCFYGYMARYVPVALGSLDFETLARVHNGGPAAYKVSRKKYTDLYWARVRNELMKIRESKGFQA